MAKAHPGRVGRRLAAIVAADVAIPRVLRASAISLSVRARLQCLADDWLHGGRVAIRLGLHGLHSALAGLVEPLGYRG
jgi:hypothetical protein